MKHRITRVVLAAVSVLALAACAGASTPTATATPTPVTSSVPEDAQAVRFAIREYWEGFNSYDKERVLPLLTPEYHAVRSERIITDIGRLRQFRVKLGWKEESPPLLRADGTGQAFISITEPLGTRRVQMDFEKRAEGWKITFVDEVGRPGPTGDP